MAGSSFYSISNTTPQPTVTETSSGNTDNPSSFYETNPTPENTPALTVALQNATDAANALNRYYVVYENPWAATVNINWDLANNHRLTLTGNTILTFSGGRDGDRLILDLAQDTTGNRLVTFPSNVSYGTTIPAIILSTGASKVDKLGFMRNVSIDKYQLVSVAYGF